MTCTTLYYAHRPHVVGYDISGVVTQCGAEVTKFNVGDAVFGMLPHNRNGALAEYVHGACITTHATDNGRLSHAHMFMCEQSRERR